jgi:hypothetical protein
MSATIGLALRSFSQLGTLWRSLCSDLCVPCLDSIDSLFVDREPYLDVYSYNFPGDRRVLKLLGEYLTFFAGFNAVTKNHY